MAAIRILARLEPLLIFLAGPPLVFTEVFPPAARTIALAWIALLWTARLLATGRITFSTPLDPPLVALALMIPAAVAAASSADAALSRVYSLIFAVAVFYSLANGLSRPRHAWSAAMWLLVAGMGLSAVGLLTVDWLEKMPAAPAVIARLPTAALTMPHPTLSAGVHPNQLAGLLVLFVPLAVSLLLWPRPAHASMSAAHAAVSAANAPAFAAPGGGLGPPLAVRGVAKLSLIATTPTLILTQSRGAWFGLVAALAAMAVAYTFGDSFVAAGRGRISRHRGPARRRARGAAAVAAIALTVAVLSPAAFAVFLGQQERGPPETMASAILQGRAGVWADVLEMIVESPLSGIGLNTFPLVYDQRPEYEGHYIYAGIAHAHNTLLQSAVDFGLPGMVAVAGIMAALAWAALRTAHRLGATPMAPLIVGLSFGLLAHALHGLVDSVAIGSKTGFIPWAFAGTLVAMRLHGRVWTADNPFVAGSVVSHDPAVLAVPAATTSAPALSAPPMGAHDPATPVLRSPMIEDGAASGYRRFGWAPAIVLWIATSFVAVYLAGDDSVFAAVVAACSGGAVFGLLSARRLDGHRERVRHRRTRRKRTKRI